MYNIPLSLGFSGVPGFLDHSVMPGDVPSYMLDDTVVDTSADDAPTALVNCANDEKTQAHDGNPGAIFSPMDTSMTHEGAVATPSVQGVHVPLFSPTVDLAGDLALALARAKAVEAEVLALRAEVADGARREAALQVQVAQAQEGMVLAVEVFREQMDVHRLRFKSAWVAMKTAYKKMVGEYIESKLLEVVAAQDAMGVAQAERDKMAEKCGKLEVKVGKLEEAARQGVRGGMPCPPPCSICQEPLVEGLAAFPCGHVLHGVCAGDVEASSRPRCPECPQPVIKRDILRLFYSPSVALSVGSGGARDAPLIRYRR